MLGRSQIARLIPLGLALWGAAALYVRLLPASIVDPVAGAAGFACSVPMGWLSILLARRIGALRPDQLLAGVSLVGAIAMMVDGVALRWRPLVYGTDATAVRLGAAWLLWGYGISFALAVAMTQRARSSRGRDAG